MRWLYSITDSVDMNLSKLWETAQSYLSFYLRLAIMQNLLVKQIIKYTDPMEGFLYISVLAGNKAIMHPAWS